MSLILLVLVVLFILPRLGKTAKRIYIVVLGDIGRSPRMQYHAISFAEAGFDVYLFGYGGSEPNSAIKSNPAIHLIYLKPVPAIIQRLPKFLGFVLKVVWQSITLAGTLLFCWRPSHILVQNPPSVPTLFISWFISKLKACKFVIDWHNYGYTIMALSVGPQHVLTRIYERYERIVGRFATANICVTNAMRLDLLENWHIRAVTMYDRPPSIFKSLELEDKQSFLHRFSIFQGHGGSCIESTEATLFTECDEQGMVRYNPNRPALLISSTSWTEDEDFSILLSALDAYDSTASKDGVNLPSIVCVITGKGPQKEHYQRVIKSKNWSKVKVFTPWLEPDDYPKLLACADFGVCLHKSSSGLDLPMKVIDMFGCGLPVCAINFKSLGELVRHEENGLIFRTDSELADQLQRVLHGFPKNNLFNKLHDNLKAFQQVRWNDVWKEAVGPIFLSGN